MGKLNMNGSYSFDRETINEEITKTSCGNYALGYVKDGTFYVQYVGRADYDLNKRLLDHLGENYKHFKYSYATSPKAAFEKECFNYHDFGGVKGNLHNEIHPDRPSNSKNWRCPVCDIFD